MKCLSVTALALAFLVGVVANADAADKAAKKAAKKGVTGTVVSVKKDDGKDTGTFKAKVAAKAKKGAPAPAPEEKTFTVTADTKIETISGKKANATATAAKFSDLAEGKAVTIFADGDKVTNVKITAAKKKKKTK